MQSGMVRGTEAYVRLRELGGLPSAAKRRYARQRAWLLRIGLLIVAVGASIEVLAADYRCSVTQKFDWGHRYTGQELAQGQFSVLIEERSDSVYISRCSYIPSARRVTCDRYKIDEVVRDAYIGANKHYLFRSQFDIQVFRDLSFIENNGRGGISYGGCEVISP